MGDEIPTELVKLLKDQKTTGGRIANFITNTTKLGASALNFDTLNNRLTVIEKYWTEYSDRDLVLSREDDTLQNEEYFMNDDFSETEVAYTKGKSYVTAKLTELYAQAQDNGRPAQSTSGAMVPAIQLTTTASSLPKLSLPRFDGRQEDWDSFKDIFSSMVKDLPTLTPTLKLQHLLACVEGDAARSIKNLDVTGPNFDVAWETLTRRYENRPLRIMRYMQRLICMPPATSRSVTEYTRLLDTSNECRRGLQALHEPVEHWDRWFITLIVLKLDITTREAWEQVRTADDRPETAPQYAHLVNFLEGRIQALDTAHCSEPSYAPGKSSASRSRTHQTTKSVSSHHVSADRGSSDKRLRCTLCLKDHRLGACGTFLAYAMDQRWKYVREKKLCFNCLSPQHITTSCPSSFRCLKCKQLHHTSLHRAPTQTGAGVVEPSSGSSAPPPPNSLNSFTTAIDGNMLLGTAIIVLLTDQGDQVTVRALIDPASEGSFITERVVQLLRLRKQPLHTSVTGLGGAVHLVTNATVRCRLRPTNVRYPLIDFSAAVTNQLSTLLPKHTTTQERWPHLQGIELADASYHVAAPVECLLGADVYPQVIQGGIRHGPPGSPIAQRTVFGWIVTGPAHGSPSSKPSRTIECFTTRLDHRDDIGNQLRRFWEMEEVAPAGDVIPLDDECETHFQATHTRLSTGRYEVRLPFTEMPCTPNSRPISQNRLISLERRLHTNEPLLSQYQQFMQQYLQLGHMREIVAETSPEDCTYIPHHAVGGPPGTRKLRVVFDASQRYRNGKSLNDFLHAGPKL